MDYICCCTALGVRDIKETRAFKILSEKKGQEITLDAAVILPTLNRPSRMDLKYPEGRASGQYWSKGCRQIGD